MRVGSMGLRGFAIVVAMALSGCTVGEGAGDQDPVAPVGPGEPGSEITVSGPVSRLVDAHVFEIGTDGGEPVLVVALAGARGLMAGVAAEVTGTVETFEAAAIERRIGVPLHPDLHRLNGRRCVVARTVEVRERAR